MPKIGIFMYLDVTNKLRMKLYAHVLQSGSQFYTIHNNLKISDHLIAYGVFSVCCLSLPFSLSLPPPHSIS